VLPLAVLVGQSVRVIDDHEIEQTRLRARLEIVDGLVRALIEHEAIDELMWSAQDSADAHAQLTAPPHSYSDIQAHHVLDLPLRRRTRADRERLHREAEGLRLQLRES
jgi:DNA gyrase/topoisomerase IV subunit A